MIRRAILIYLLSFFGLAWLLYVGCWLLLHPPRRRRGVLSQ